MQELELCIHDIEQWFSDSLERQVRQFDLHLASRSLSKRKMLIHSFTFVRPWYKQIITDNECSVLEASLPLKHRWNRSENLFCRNLVSFLKFFVFSIASWILHYTYWYWRSWVRNHKNQTRFFFSFVSDLKFINYLACA